MSNPIRIWICTAYSPVYRWGGWAMVRVAQGTAAGSAGGERTTTAARMALTGLGAALRDLAPNTAPASPPIRIETTSPELAEFAGFLAGLGGADAAAAPEDNLDLWAPISIAAKGRRLSLVHTPLEAETPAAFTSAWADLSMERAKTKGVFAFAIPKPNLAKFPGLNVR